MLRFSRIRFALALLAASLPALTTAAAWAQNDPNEAPLGDVARNLRKKTPPSQGVIDDDNLSQVMKQSESRQAQSSTLKFLMAGESNNFRVSSPDVTCSLAFSANAKSLLSSQYAQMELPPGEMEKLAGPATIEGDALIVPVFNGTDWHVSEVAVALTVVKKNRAADVSLNDGTARSATAGAMGPEAEVRPEKKPDTTVIYRMRAAAAPAATTVFSAPVSLDLAAGDEWHWAIVQARGYPPPGYVASGPQVAAQAERAPVQPAIPSSLLMPGDVSATPLPPN